MEEADHFETKRNKNQVLLEVEIDQNLDLKEPVKILQFRWKNFKNIEDFEQEEPSQFVILILGFNNLSNAKNKRQRKPDVLAVIACDYNERSKQTKLQNLNYP